MNLTSHTELFSGFSKLSRQERYARLVQMGALTAEDVNFFESGGLQSLDLAEKLVENVIGYFQLPLGVAANFRIDERDIPIPMAVEETSIIAAASKTARWVRECGTITTETIGNTSIGQIQIAQVKNFANLLAKIEENADNLIKDANNTVAAGLVKRGGGVVSLHVRRQPRGDGRDMAMIHAQVNTCDAMGANIINQICEYLKPLIEKLTGEFVTMCILSNLVDTKLTRATVRLKNIDPILAYKLEEASIFAENDPYRAATHNKGILNGIDPVAIATGNDWRAIEAGMHAYAARDGQYRSLTQWRLQGNDLIGVLEAPIIVGTVGGVTRLHPSAQICLKMLGVNSANELSRILAAVGIVQNLGAINALTTAGIIAGHMKLHISNLVLAVNATEEEQKQLVTQLELILHERQRVSLSDATELLAELRKQHRLIFP